MEKKTPMPTIDPKIRNKSFIEVTCGYSEKDALIEADRCLNCIHQPCVKGCPVNINIPAFIQEIKKQDYLKAYQIIAQTNNLPAICGRVCPQEAQCEAVCVKGIRNESVGIGRLERFIGDWFNTQTNNVTNASLTKDKVAIIGSGPSGLSCAAELAKAGFQPTIFEALHMAGGVLVYGIPEFRLPKKVVDKEIDNLVNMGVKIVTNTIIGKTITIAELFEASFKAIYIATGAGLPKFMNIPGESLNGVYAANEFLTRINLMKGYQKNSMTPVYVGENVVVVGGGNVAMDAARSALRNGAKKVTIVYRRSMNELPARHEEVEHAIEEGIEFKLLTSPIEILKDDKYQVKGIKCIKMELSKPDESNRQRPVEVEGSDFEIVCDMVIMAIGTSPNPLIKQSTPELATNKWGCIITDDDGATNLANVYAGGDAVTGAATVIKAMQAGKLAAKAIITKLTN